jgi:hypothetical protein
MKQIEWERTISLFRIVSVIIGVMFLISVPIIMGLQ